MHPQKPLSRRQFLLTSATVTSTIIGTDIINKLVFAQAPAIITSEKYRPQIPYGVNLES
jgi:alkaline phosphatase D